MYTLVFGGVGIVIGFIVCANTSGSALMGIFFGVIIGGALTLLLGGRGLAIDVSAAKGKEVMKKEQQLLSLYQAIQPYLQILARKKKQLYLTDDYGNFDDSRWRKEVAYFFTKTIGTLAGDRIYIDGNEIFELIDWAADSTSQENTDEFDANMSPYDYEHFCVQLIENAGWSASVTQCVGDQGIDIIARKDNFTVVVQCTMYSTPVGNKAVQEANAGKGFIQADAAIVVTNSSFTPSARQLAASPDIRLLHHEDLWKINELPRAHAFRNA